MGAAWNSWSVRGLLRQRGSIGCTPPTCPQGSEQAMGVCLSVSTPCALTRHHHSDTYISPTSGSQTHLDISCCSQTKALFFEVNHFKALNRSSVFRGPFHEIRKVIFSFSIESNRQTYINPCFRKQELLLGHILFTQLSGNKAQTVSITENTNTPIITP